MSISLFIATTIDGFIADENGSIDWLLEFPNPNQTDHGYFDFIKDIDVLVMGRKTYEQLISFGVDWPYKENSTFVVTKNKNLEIKSVNTYILDDINRDLIGNLIANSKNIWLVGGGDIISQFIHLGYIDRMILSVVPIILGKGIRLFPGAPIETRFRLAGTETFETGIINLIYHKLST